VDETKITVTVEELQEAVTNYDLILRSEVEEVFKVFLAVPGFGQKVAGAMQAAINLAGRDKAKQSQVLNAPVLASFLMGVMVGRGQGRRGLDENPS
jgi:hypothetical protein